jgi:hypothetical protein
VFGGLSEESEVNERHDPQSKQKCVGLKIADLKQPQKRANSEGAAAYSADRSGINDPAIEERGDLRQKPLSPVDQPLVKFVEVKAAPDKIDMERIALAIAIEQNPDSNA